MKKVTLDRIAAMAGVGVATVDRVLNERGGVSPHTTLKVLQAAKLAGLKRILPDSYRQAWQIEVILSSNDTYFFQKLAEDFRKVADLMGYQRIALHRTLLSEAYPEKVAQHINRCRISRDGIIVFAQDNPEIIAAIDECQSNGVPVITVASDLRQAKRLCHVGINQYQAGRTAGLLMSKIVPAQGDVLLVTGRHEYTAHQQRIAGFKSALLQRGPHITIRAILAGEDQRERLSRLLDNALSGLPRLAGLYNTGDVNAEVSRLLSRYQLLGKCAYLTHELYPITSQLLKADQLSFVIDQNAYRHADIALKLMVDYLEDHKVPDTYQEGEVPFTIFTAENCY